VESTEGIGSTFTASIDAGVSAAASLITRIPPVLEQMHSQTVIEKRCGAVLLADDVEENRQLISLYLRKVGASVTCVENGLHAVNSALAGAFDLILMDMQMPVMDGLEATTLLRSRGYTRPIIVLTANVMKTDVDKYLHSGFDGFIGKPINRVEFMATVARYLKMADAHKVTTSAVALPALRSELLDREPELAELVAKFLRALPDYAAELAALCRSKKWAELTAQLHDFKSMSGNYGFPQISTLALQVEEEIHGEHFDTVPRLIEQLVDMAAQACSAVSTN